METSQLLSRIRTPNKLGNLVLAPSYKAGQFDSHVVDVPFLFRYQGRFGMTFVGWDKVGYRTGLAWSDDLVHWTKEGLILDRGPRNSINEFNIALTNILRDNDLFGSGELKQVNGRFVGTYHSYPAAGYETGPAAIGLCFSEDLRHWEIQKPFLFARDGAEWERSGLYKSWLMEHDGVYYLFYNAKDKAEWPWLEQTGIARSSDLVHWERYEGNPVLKVGNPGSFDDVFASDPCVFRCGSDWVMFYFGNSSDGHARESVAFSSDLLHWEKSNETLVDVGPEGSTDSQHAHKPGMIAWNGRLYHFYCAVQPAKEKRMGDVECEEIRGIALATS